MHIAMQSRLSASLALSWSKERHGSACAVLVLLVLFSKNNQKKKVKSLATFFQSGIFSITSCVNCSKQTKIGVSSL